MSKHARIRGFERYNQTLTKRDEHNIVEKLKNNDMLFLYDSENDKRRKFAYVVYNNVPYKVLYHRTKSGIQGIVTIYPFDVEEYNALIQEEEIYKKCMRLAVEEAKRILKINKYIVYQRKPKEY